MTMTTAIRERIENLLVNTGRWGHISCAIDGDPADGFGYCSCGLESEVIKPLVALLQSVDRESRVKSRMEENILCRSYLRYPDPYKRMEEHYVELEALTRRQHGG